MEAPRGSEFFLLHQTCSLADAKSIFSYGMCRHLVVGNCSWGAFEAKAK